MDRGAPIALDAALAARRALCVASALTLLGLCSAPAPAQRALHPQHAAVSAQHAPSAFPDPVAVDLLHKMVTPTAPYAGEQVTERRGVVSHQHVEGDTRGRIRMDYRDPAELNGDVMLIAPHWFRNYHRKTNTVDIALWPNRREPGNSYHRMEESLKQHRIIVEKTGEQMVAGRNAAIVQIVSAGSASRHTGLQFTFWIDAETGIKLKQEVTGPHGLVSRSSFTSITVGPGANVKPKDFDPQIVQTAQPNPLFPPDAQEFTSLDAARPLLPFAPKEPATLPEGFKLAHVWVFPAANPHSNLHAGALIRYSDGMAHFNLYEHLGRPNPDHAHGGHSNDARSERRSVQHWHFPAPDGRVLDVVYIGVLPREQLATVRNSLK